ncbi:MAG: hypothetical protein ABW184_01035 [Sphingobium sp.]
MRSTGDSVTVRLYHLDGDMEGGGIRTILYGTMLEALERGQQEPEDVQEWLFIETDNDVIAYLDLISD